MKTNAGDLVVVPSGFFLLRTPLLPFSDLTAWAEGLEAASQVGDPEALGDALARDRTRLRERLTRLAARPELREAIFLASPSLDAGLEAWREAPDSDRGRKAEPSLVAKESRTCPSPAAPNASPGVTATWASWRNRSAAWVEVIPVPRMSANA